MFRQSVRRLPHQLIKEPMGLEHDTMSRARDTYARGLQTAKEYAMFGGVGMGLGLLFIFAKSTKAQTIDAQGKLTK